MSVMNYGALFKAEVSNDTRSRVYDLARGLVLPASLTIDASVTGDGTGELPVVVIEGAAPVPGRKPARPGSFEALATSEPLDGGTTWSVTLDATQLRRYMRVRVRYRHTVWTPFDPRYRDYDGWQIDRPDDFPRAARRLEVVATGEPA